MHDICSHAHEIRQGDCLEVMRDMEPDSIDAVVTDPPYGLSFLGKSWDHAVPGPEYFTEMLRVMKPGAHLLAFGGTRLFHRMACSIEDAGFEIRDCVMWVYGGGMPKTSNLSKVIAKVSGPERAKKWDGWSTGLKPAWEPIVVARKPFKDTVAANVLKHGTGALNVDGCRVPGEPQTTCKAGNFQGYRKDGGVFGFRDGKWGDVPDGRWPANVIHDGSDEAIGGFPDSVSGSGIRSKNNGNVYGSSSMNGVGQIFSYGDSGSTSRYFYCAKASTRERGEGNNHPTVKPIALMRYLVRLITPPGGCVLDPFAGSGSAGVACVHERFGFLGIEQDEEYCRIARQRIVSQYDEGELPYGGDDAMH